MSALKFSKYVLPLLISAHIPVANTIIGNGPAQARQLVPPASKLMAVIPFEPLKQRSSPPNVVDPVSTIVPIMVDVNGRHGIFSLDLGEPWVMLSPLYFRPTANGGVDTSMLNLNNASAKQSVEDAPWVRVHATFHFGKLLDSSDDSVLRRTWHPFMRPSVAGDIPWAIPPEMIRDRVSARPVNAVIGYRVGTMDCCVAGPIVGSLGLSALESFETIIDYTHRRVVFIRLDAAGRRLAPVPEYTPRFTAPLLEIAGRRYFERWWGIAVRSDHTLDTLQTANNTSPMKLDTGSSDNGYDVLGYPFLRQAGVVGFNPRTHQFLLYR